MSDIAQKHSQPEKAVHPSSGDAVGVPEKQSLIDEVMDFVKHHPVSTALALTAVSVAGFGAARIGLAGRLGTAALDMGGTTFAEGGATLAEGGTTLGESALTASKPVIHLTSAEAFEAITQTGRLGGRWGLFAVDADSVPLTQVGRMANTLVARNLNAEIEITGEAANAFKRPPMSGPFSMVRRMAGVRSTPLGSVDLTTNKFIANEIYTNGVFRPATSAEIAKYKVHQWILDYGIDAEFYALGSTEALVIESESNRNHTPNRNHHGKR